MSDLEKNVRDWVQSVDRPISMDEVIVRPSNRTVWPARIPVPVAVASVAAILVLGVLAAVFTGGDDGVASVTAATSTSSTPPPSASAPVVPPTWPEVCPDLRSESTWEATRDASELVTGAGTSALYRETVTNDGSEPCSLERHPCRTVQLFDLDGTPIEAPLELGCALMATPVDLAPGDSLELTLFAPLHAAPGRYLVHVGRYDGTTDRLPVRLEDRHAACPASALAVRGNGTPIWLRSGEGLAWLVRVVGE
ncbi:DUF4232 domain-containing protein [Actinospongicola halichondriae]|uniref:DUF4232 domain-containing protein n=1 Tax=Actinospongicola halichondriae TaxID=3236844 RepID=UPI003D4FD90A